MWNNQANNKDWNIQIEEKDTIRCIILKKAERQIRTLLRKYEKLEWLAGLKGTINKDLIVITEIKLYEQEIQGTYVTLTNKGNEDMSKDNNIGWIHSHNDMKAFFSSTDKITNLQHKVSIVINNKFETEAQIRCETELGTKVNIPLEIETEKEEDDQETIITSQELIKEKKTETKEEKEQKILDYYIIGKDINCAKCLQKVKKNHAIIEDGVPFHKKCYQSEIIKLTHYEEEKKNRPEFKELEEIMEICNRCYSEKKYCMCKTGGYDYYG